MVLWGERLVKGRRSVGEDGGWSAMCYKQMRGSLGHGHRGVRVGDKVGWGD